MIRRPPRSTLFPTRRSSDLSPEHPMFTGIRYQGSQQFVIVCGGQYSRVQFIDRKSTRLNSSHQIISYAVFCLKKKKKKPHNCTNCTKQHHTQPTHLSYMNCT